MNVPNGPRMFKHGVNYPQATRQKLYSKNTVRDIGSAVRFVCTVEVHLVVNSAFWFLKNSVQFWVTLSFELRVELVLV